MFASLKSHLSLSLSQCYNGHAHLEASAKAADTFPKNPRLPAAGLMINLPPYYFFC
jgi:hypothetical protein